MKHILLLVAATIISISGCNKHSQVIDRSAHGDCWTVVNLQGKVCVDFGHQGFAGDDPDYCSQLWGIKVSLYNKHNAHDVPVDYTDREGKFFVNDIFHYAILDHEINSLKEGEIPWYKNPWFYLRFTHPSLEETFFDLHSISSEGWIESATPITVKMKIANYEEYKEEED